MKKFICLLLVLVSCLSFASVAFAAEDIAEDNFVDSPEDTAPTTENGGGVDGEGDSNTTVPEGTIDSDGNPKDGDSSAIGLWIGVMLLAAAALVGMVSVYRKKFANN